MFLLLTTCIDLISGRSMGSANAAFSPSYVGLVKRSASNGLLLCVTFIHVVFQEIENVLQVGGKVAHTRIFQRRARFVGVNV